MLLLDLGHIRQAHGNIPENVALSGTLLGHFYASSCTESLKFKPESGISLPAKNSGRVDKTVNSQLSGKLWRLLENSQPFCLFSLLRSLDGTKSTRFEELAAWPKGRRRILIFIDSARTAI